MPWLSDMDFTVNAPAGHEQAPSSPPSADDCVVPPITFRDPRSLQVPVAVKHLKTALGFGEGRYTEVLPIQNEALKFWGQDSDDEIKTPVLFVDVPFLLVDLINDHQIMAARDGKCSNSLFYYREEGNPEWLPRPEHLADLGRIACNFTELSCEYIPVEKLVTVDRDLRRKRQRAYRWVLIIMRNPTVGLVILLRDQDRYLMCNIPATDPNDDIALAGEDQGCKERENFPEWWLNEEIHQAKEVEDAKGVKGLDGVEFKLGNAEEWEDIPWVTQDPWDEEGRNLPDSGASGRM